MWALICRVHKIPHLWSLQIPANSSDLAIEAETFVVFSPSHTPSLSLSLPQVSSFSLHFVFFPVFGRVLGVLGTFYFIYSGIGMTEMVADGETEKPVFSGESAAVHCERMRAFVLSCLLLCGPAEGVPWPRGKISWARRLACNGRMATSTMLLSISMTRWQGCTLSVTVHTVTVFF